MDSVIYRDRRGRMVEAARLWGRYLTGSVLDVGCDVRHLAGLVPGDYLGVDIAGSPDLRVDLEEPLPFADRAFDTVICMATLEHVNGIHDAFDELCRVSRRWLIISLPNALEWRDRARMMAGRFTGKYGLALDRPADRHHWIFGFSDAREFVTGRGERNGFAVTREACAYRAWRRWPALIISLLGCLLAPRCAGLLAVSYWAVLGRE